MISSLRHLIFSATLSSTSEPLLPPKRCDYTSQASTIQKASIDCPKPKSIDSLPISQKNKETIQNLVKELATSSIFHLTCNGLKLMRTGTLLRKEVHPYRFYSEILSDPESKGFFGKIYEERNQILSGRAQIWSDFCSNAGGTFQDYAEDIDCYTLSFADRFQLDPLIIKSLQSKLDWEGLLSYFIGER
jgi:hypothetical protein